jgi:RimJ/RimL family protein N-acetyltransferase
VPEIETARLRLRHFTLDDFDNLYRLYCDAEVMKYLSLRTREQTQASLDKHINHWAVTLKEDGTVIGRCGLGFLDNTPEVELGYVFDKSYWNMGIATEASNATVKYGFEEAKLKRIVAISNPQNITSIGVISCPVKQLSLKLTRSSQRRKRSAKFL